MEIRELQKRYDILSGRKALLREQWEEKSVLWSKSNDKHYVASEAYRVVEAFVRDRKGAVDKISELITQGIWSVMKDKSYLYQIEIDIKRNSVVYTQLVSSASTGTKRVKLLDGFGGGLLNLISFLLRVLIVLYNSKGDDAIKYVVLDEPFRNLSVEYRDAAAALVKELADKTGVQFIIISHEPEIDVDGENTIFLCRCDGGVKYVS